MKKLLAISIMLLALIVSSNCQSDSKKSNVVYLKASNVENYKTIKYITYVTKNKDTLYVMEDIFSIFDDIWKNPKFKDEKPVLIAVSISTLASYYPEEKKKKSKKKKDRITTTKINNKKSKKKRGKGKESIVSL